MRQDITFTAPAADANGDQQTSNSAEIAFPVATADWGTISHIAVYDSAATPNLLFHGALSATKTIATNDQLKFAANALKFTVK